MPYGLYISAEGAQAQSQWLETISNNLANVDTVGFKRTLGIFQARYAEAVSRGDASPGTGSLDDLGGGVAFRETKLDFSPGPLKRTDVATDAAIPGEGFFVVRKGQENYLTRAGNFRLNGNGELVTQQGYAVLSDGNSPIAINPTAGPWQITADGAVRQAGAAQSLAIVTPASLSDLTEVGENLYRVQGTPQPITPARRAVAQGYLEMSGVKPTTEMTALIEASRLVEANVNMMKAQDQMLGGLISRVLKA